MSEEAKRTIVMPGSQFREQLKEEMIAGTFKALLLFDIDELRRVNVQAGFEVGDKILALAERFFEGKGWKGFRTGGDEFGVIITTSDPGFNSEAFHGEIVKFLTDNVGFKVRISGGGLQEPGAEYGMFAVMFFLMVSTPLGRHIRWPGQNSKTIQRQEN